MNTNVLIRRIDALGEVAIARLAAQKPMSRLVRQIITLFMCQAKSEAFRLIAYVVVTRMNRSAIFDKNMERNNALALRQASKELFA